MPKALTGLAPSESSSLSDIISAETVIFYQILKNVVQKRIVSPNKLLVTTTMVTKNNYVMHNKKSLSLFILRFVIYSFIIVTSVISRPEVADVA